MSHALLPLFAFCFRKSLIHAPENLSESALSVPLIRTPAVTTWTYR